MLEVIDAKRYGMGNIYSSIRCRLCSRYATGGKTIADKEASTRMQMSVCLVLPRTAGMSADVMGF